MYINIISRYTYNCINRFTYGQVEAEPRLTGSKERQII